MKPQTAPPRSAPCPVQSKFRGEPGPPSPRRRDAGLPGIAPSPGRAARDQGRGGEGGRREARLKIKAPASILLGPLGPEPAVWGPVGEGAPVLGPSGCPLGPLPPTLLAAGAWPEDIRSRAARGMLRISARFPRRRHPRLALRALGKRQGFLPRAYLVDGLKERREEGGRQ